MSYRVELENRAIRELRALPLEVIRSIDRAISGLAANAIPNGGVRVRGNVGNGWRVRVGDYRILYTVDETEQLVRVYRIRHRREAYR